MSLQPEQIKETVRNYIRENFMRNADSKELTDNTRLISGGVIDSILTMKLVVFLEKTFHFEFAAHEVDKDNLDSVEIIAGFVMKKTNA